MKIIADLHTHSKYSKWFHGKNTIEEMALYANEIGLEELAITDHGYKHPCGTTKEKLREARIQVDEINTWSKTKILLGIEADILSEDGTLDIDIETMALIDILIVGYHRCIKTDFAGFFGGQKNERAAIAKATNAYLNAIDKYPVTIISHLDSILKTDVYKIGRACREKGVMIEINNRHLNWNDAKINDLLASECMFVVSSDAHRREDIGNVDNALELIRKYKIPSEQFANLQFSPDEMTEVDKESRIYYNIFLKKQEEQKAKDIAEQQKKATQFTGSLLSNEMEEQLKDIAKEKGINYTGVQTTREVKEPETIDDFIKSPEMEKANEYYNKLKRQDAVDENIDANSFESFKRTGVISERPVEYSGNSQQIVNEQSKQFDQMVKDQKQGVVQQNNTPNQSGFTPQLSTDQEKEQKPAQVVQESNVGINSLGYSVVGATKQENIEQKLAENPVSANQSGTANAQTTENKPNESSNQVKERPIVNPSTIFRGVVIEKNGQANSEQNPAAENKAEETKKQESPSDYLNFGFIQKTPEKTEPEPVPDTKPTKTDRPRTIGFVDITDLTEDNK